MESDGDSNGHQDEEEISMISPMAMPSSPHRRIEDLNWRPGSMEPGGLAARSSHGTQKLIIIRETIDCDNPQEKFELQLERALQDCVETIVIEPYNLGDETARWIVVGNVLHKTAVLTGLGSIIGAFVWPGRPFLYMPATIISCLCTGLYSISWQFDPCCKYQVEKDPANLSKLSLAGLRKSSPVVLTRKDDTRRKILHCVISEISFVYTMMKMYWPSGFLKGLVGVGSQVSSTTVPNNLPALGVTSGTEMMSTGVEGPGSLKNDFSNFPSFSASGHKSW